MKRQFSFIYIVVSLLILAACDKDGGSDVERGYTVEGAFAVDSTVVLDRLVLYTDSHSGLSFDSLDLSPQSTFVHHGSTLSLDELYLCSDGGELSRFYASGHSKVSMRFEMQADSMVVKFDPASGDTINPWLQQQKAHFGNLSRQQKKLTIDTLCHEQPYDVRCALLLRDQIEVLDDSIFVRRCLGSLEDEAKPNWLMKSIDQILDESTVRPRQYRRLAACKMEGDSTTFDYSASRSDYLLIHIWADYSQPSVDSIRVLERLVKEQFDMKRLKLVTICLGAPGQMWWKQQVEGIDGLHFWLPAGIGDERMRKWGVKEVPTVIICDMYNNQQLRNEWGERLRAQLNRVPNRSGFSHTPKSKSKVNRGR